MVGILTAISLSLVMGQAAWAVNIAERDGNCTDVHFLLARGTGEPYPGVQIDLVNDVCGQLGNCDSEDIIYPALTNATAEYCVSVEGGLQNGTQQITNYAQRCPDSKIVLSGYSQGGQVISDILGGAGGFLWGICTQPDSGPSFTPATSPGDHIAAVVLWGDARHTANQSYNILSGAGDNSPAPRTPAMLSALDGYASVTRSYCEAGDPVCANGTDMNIHLTYFNNYTSDAASWVVSMVNKTSQPSKKSSAETTAATTTTSLSSSVSTSEASTTSLSFSSLTTSETSTASLLSSLSSTTADTTASVTTDSSGTSDSTASKAVAAVSEATSSTPSPSSTKSSDTARVGFGSNLASLVIAMVVALFCVSSFHT